MSEKTKRNLALALAAESQASARDTAFAQKADHEANPLLARLFRALAIRVRSCPAVSAVVAWKNRRQPGKPGIRPHP